MMLSYDCYNLDNSIVFETLPLPLLRLLVFIGNKNLRDINGLKDAKIRN